MEQIRGEPNYKSTAAPPEQNDPYDEALKVLGLPTTFDREEMNRHYKRLMLSVHPDKGRNDWLGSRINTAKDIICKMKGWKK